MRIFARQSTIVFKYHRCNLEEGWSDIFIISKLRKESSIYSSYFYEGKKMGISLPDVKKRRDKIKLKYVSTKIDLEKKKRRDFPEKLIKTHVTKKMLGLLFP